MTRLYLASTSPRRRALLRAAGFRFTLLRPAPDPPAPAVSPDPARLAVAHARHKALSVRPPAARGLVIGVDTIVVLGNRVLGKPADPDAARAMLEQLSGRTHRVISGLAVRPADRRRVRTAAETTFVRFRRLTRTEIESCVGSDEPYDKAGAYGIQGRAGAFVSRIRGSYLNVVGLPLARLLLLLQTEPDARPRAAGQK